MNQFQHQRHKEPTSLDRPRELVLACAPLRSNVNLSRIVRAASCSGVTRVIACGNAKLDPKIARDGATAINLEKRRSLPSALKKLREDGFQLVGLEQTSNSQLLTEFAFTRRTALVIGNERTGLTEDLLQQVDAVVEIPVFGMPFSFNVATATAIAVYEYCRQFPKG